MLLTVATMKMSVFWEVASCSLLEVYRRFADTATMIREMNHHTDDGGIFL
jgi:hypothetical protein